VKLVKVFFSLSVDAEMFVFLP